MPITNVPTIPRYITVHLGAPGSDAQNVTVSFSQYIKNVASSEIYPTWRTAAIYANIYAQISYALNRVYTRFYRNQGYNFDITSSTAYDQKFINGRTIFENISKIVDEIFTTYIRRINYIEPLAAKYCNGTTVTCNGLSQWGSEYLARDGYSSFEILTYYYGDDIELVRNAPIEDISSIYPGTALRRGDSGEAVRVIQNALNVVSRNYPAVPRVTVDGIFGESTENSVRTFQRIFNLTSDGVVGEATWNKLSLLYVAILRLAELDSEGLTLFGSSFEYPQALRRGDSDRSVVILQYMLNVVAEFYDSVSSAGSSGVFDAQTENSVLSFQRAFSLNRDGVVGRATWDALYRAYSGISTTVLIPDRSSLSFPGSTVSTGNSDFS